MDSELLGRPAEILPNSATVARMPGWRLKLLVFVSGAVLMGLEMAGSRILASHFGSSIYVWGSIIGVFLAALSGGYFAGGLAADRKPSFFLLNVLVLLAGCWLLVLPLYGNLVCRVIRSANLGSRLEPLLATTILFGGPSLLMGMVSPFAVRLSASVIDRIGNTAGRLYALSTLGSIVGTLVTAFWLIPIIGVHTILKSLGISLVVIAMIGLPKSRATLRIAVPLFLVVISALLIGPAAFISLRADQHVRFHDGPLFAIERTAFQQHRVRHADLADVVEHACLPDDLDLVGGESDMPREHQRNLGDHGRGGFAGAPARTGAVE